MEFNTQASPNSSISTELTGTMSGDESKKGKVCASRFPRITRSWDGATAATTTTTTRKTGSAMKTTVRAKTTKDHKVSFRLSKKYRLAGNTIARQTAFDSLDWSTFKVSFSLPLQQENLRKTKRKQYYSVGDQETSSCIRTKDFGKHPNATLPKCHVNDDIASTQYAASGSFNQTNRDNCEHTHAVSDCANSKGVNFTVEPTLPTKPYATLEKLFVSKQLPTSPRKATKASAFVSTDVGVVKSKRKQATSVSPMTYPPIHQQTDTKEMGTNLIEKTLPLHDSDVLMGRGKDIIDRHGNKFYTALCRNAGEAYAACHSSEAIKSVIRQVRARNPPGRFLERKNDGSFVDVSPERLRPRIYQALQKQRYRTPPPQELKQPKVPKPDVGHGAMRHQHTAPTWKVQQKPTLVRTNKKSSIELVDDRIGPQSRLAVFWPMDKTYYNATVVERIQNCVYLRYDDLETEWLDLTKHDFVVLDTACNDKASSVQGLNTISPLSPEVASLASYHSPVS